MKNMKEIGDVENALAFNESMSYPYSFQSYFSPKSIKYI